MVLDPWYLVFGWSFLFLLSPPAAVETGLSFCGVTTKEDNMAVCLLSLPRAAPFWCVVQCSVVQCSIQCTVVCTVQCTAYTLQHALQHIIQCSALPFGWAVISDPYIWRRLFGAGFSSARNSHQKHESMWAAISAHLQIGAVQSAPSKRAPPNHPAAIRGGVYPAASPSYLIYELSVCFILHDRVI